MGIYLNQLAKKQKTLQMERLAEHFKRLKFTDEQIEAEMALLFPYKERKRMDLSPLSKEEMARFRKCGHAKTTNELADILGVKKNAGIYRFGALAFRYIVNRVKSKKAL